MNDFTILTAAGDAYSGEKYGFCRVISDSGAVKYSHKDTRLTTSDQLVTQFYVVCTKDLPLLCLRAKELVAHVVDHLPATKALGMEELRPLAMIFLENQHAKLMIPECRPRKCKIRGEKISLDGATYSSVQALLQHTLPPGRMVVGGDGSLLLTKLGLPGCSVTLETFVQMCLAQAWRSRMKAAGLLPAKEEIKPAPAAADDPDAEPEHVPVLVDAPSRVNLPPALLADIKQALAMRTCIPTEIITSIPHALPAKLLRRDSDQCSVRLYLPEQKTIVIAMPSSVYDDIVVE